MFVCWYQVLCNSGLFCRFPTMADNVGSALCWQIKSKVHCEGVAEDKKAGWALNFMVLLHASFQLHGAEL